MSLFQSALTKEAKREADKIWELIYTNCNGLYYRSYFQDDVLQSIGEVTKVKFEIISEELSYLDKKNGWEWKGESFVKGRLCRNYSIENQEWGDWWEVGSIMAGTRGILSGIHAGISLEKKKGVWRILPHSFELPINAKKIDCSMIRK